MLGLVNVSVVRVIILSYVLYGPTLMFNRIFFGWTNLKRRAFVAFGTCVHHLLCILYLAVLRVPLHTVFQAWGVCCKVSCHASLFVEVLQHKITPVVHMSPLQKNTSFFKLSHIQVGNKLMPPVSRQLSTQPKSNGLHVMRDQGLLVTGRNAAYHFKLRSKIR